MSTAFRILACAAAFLLAGATGEAEARTEFSQSQKQLLRRMVDQADSERWVPARNAAQLARHPAAEAAYEWLRLRQPGINNFARMARWVDNRPGWPSQRRIQAQGERALPDPAFPPPALVRFFDRHPPVTGKGALYYAMALADTGNPAKAIEIAREAWLERDIGRSDEGAFLQRFGRELAPLHDRRLDNLIWRTRLSAAERHMNRASLPARTLARARIALMRGEGGVDPLVTAVPPALRNDSGLAYARMFWRKTRDLTDGAEEMMLTMSEAGNLGRPEKWADERAALVREAIRDRRHARAYALAAGHGLRSGASFADLEWLAGWIALRYLERPEAALIHFDRLYQNVETPVSLARAAYWAGEAANQLGQRDVAVQWRRRAAQSPSAFYGQQAIARLNPGGALAIPQTIPPVPGPCLADPRIDVGSALAAGGALVEARLFFYDVLPTCGTPGEAKALGLAAEALGAFRVSVGMGRKLRRKQVFIPEISHPILSLPRRGCRDIPIPERALSLAVVRQESGFDEGARSHAGARGYMQVMPETGRRIAPKAGLRFDVGKLGSDRNYNATIGQCYLSLLDERFDSSYPLMLAAYNAGPSRVERWLDANGDPRRGEIGMIDWIELIPFKETRNYVQRVLEAVEVYRARLDRGS